MLEAAILITHPLRNCLHKSDLAARHRLSEIPQSDWLFYFPTKTSGIRSGDEENRIESHQNP